MRLGHLLVGQTSSVGDDCHIYQQIDGWLTSLRVQQYSAHTIMAYESALRQFAKFVCQNQQLQGDWQSCTKKELAIFVSQRLELDALNIASVKQELSAIGQFYQFAIKQDKAQHNPTTGYRLKNKPRPLPTITTEEMMALLLEQPPPDDPKKALLWIRDKAIFELMYSSGLRLSELVGLNVTDVDMSNKSVCVLGKGNKMRIVPVGRKALEALQGYLPYCCRWQKNTNALFVSERHGRRLSQRAIQLRLKACALSAGIDQNLYPHLLRHCFASHMLSASGDLRAIQEMLGHSSISTTQIYTHVDFGSLTNVYDKAHPRAFKSYLKDGE